MEALPASLGALRRHTNTGTAMAAAAAPLEESTPGCRADPGRAVAEAPAAPGVVGVTEAGVAPIPLPPAGPPAGALHVAWTEDPAPPTPTAPGDRGMVGGRAGGMGAQRTLTPLHVPGSPTPTRQAPIKSGGSFNIATPRPGGPPCGSSGSSRPVHFELSVQLVTKEPLVVVLTADGVSPTYRLAVADTSLALKRTYSPEEGAASGVGVHMVPTSSPATPGRPAGPHAARGHARELTTLLLDVRSLVLTAPSPSKVRAVGGLLAGWSVAEGAGTGQRSRRETAATSSSGAAAAGVALLQLLSVRQLVVKHMASVQQQQQQQGGGGDAVRSLQPRAVDVVVNCHDAAAFLAPAVVAPAADLVKRLLALMTQGRAGGEHAAKKEGQRGRRTGDTLTVDVQVCVLCVCVGGGPWQ